MKAMLADELQRKKTEVAYKSHHDYLLNWLAQPIFRFSQQIYLFE